MVCEKLSSLMCKLNYRSITIGSPLSFRQKISYKTRYHWMLDLQKSRQRARFPWIPREPPTTIEIDGQLLEFPEMTLDFVVPSHLEKFDLKPYVEWRFRPPKEEPLTSERLFNQVYRDEIKEKYQQDS